MAVVGYTTGDVTYNQYDASNSGYSSTDGSSGISVDSGGDVSFTGSYSSAESRLNNYYDRAAAAAAATANNYNHSDTYTQVEFTSDNIDASNPYTKLVIVSSRFGVTGVNQFTHKPTGYATFVTYGINTAWESFENDIFDAQKAALETDVYNSSESLRTQGEADVASISSIYSNTEYGDIDAIKSEAINIAQLKVDIQQLESSQSLSDNYNRISDINNSDEIEAKQQDLSDAESSLNNLTESYDEVWTSVENSLFDNRLTSSNTANLVITSNEKSSSLDGYDDTRFGDLESINDLANQIEAVKNDIFFKQQEQSISSEYEKVDTVDNSQEITDLQSWLDALNNDFNAATDLYDAELANKEFQDMMDMLRKQENTDEFWNPIKPYWIFDSGPPPTFPRDVYTIQMSLEERVGYVSDFMNGSMNLWMAGGSLYDSPRAGDIMFNVTGDMNTTKFLGVKNNNSNKWSEWNSDRYHDYQKKVFGNLAGSDFFAVNKLAQRI